MPVDRSTGAAVKAVPTRAATVVHASVVCARWLLIALVATIFSTSAAAQQYKIDQADEKALRSSQAALLCARGAPYTDAERVKVEEYFNKGFFPDMTRYEPAALGKLGDKRDRVLFRSYLWATSNQQLQSDITKWAFDAMKRMASPGYHPAVRYNAVLIIGMLDQEYAIEAGTNRRPPKPLPEANGFLVKIVNAGAAGSKVVPPVLVAGSLVGLERHARFREGLPRESVEAMTGAVLKMVTQDKPTMDMDRDVHAWMRLKAAGVLAQLGSVGTNNQVHDALVKMISDSRSIDDRCATAALLAKIKYEGAKIDGPAATEKMLALARDVAAAEAKRAEDFRDRRFTGGGGGISMEREMYRGRSDEGGSAFVGEELDEYPRRHVLARLIGLKTGFETLKPVVPADAQTKFDAIIAALDPAIEAAANKDTVSLNVARAVVTMAGAIQAIAGGTTPAAAPADDAGFETPVEAPAATAPAEAAPAGAAPAEASPAAAEPATGR